MSRALHAATHEEGACVNRPRFDLRDAPGKTDDVNGKRAVRLCRVAELPDVVVSPALDAACGHPRAGVVAASSDLHDPRREADHVDRLEAAVILAAIAELAV
jgi:hypothetical protein